MKKVLLADDDTNSRILLEAELMAAGYEVVTAESGQEALDYIHLNRPDLIISDAMMENMDGFELCRTLKSSSDYSSLPFIFYSATYVDARDEQLALAMGAARYVIKPIDMPRLMRIVGEVLRESEDTVLNSATPAVSASIADNEQTIEKQYSQVLARKLEKKVRELEAERIATKAHMRYMEHIDTVTNALSQYVNPEERICNVLGVILKLFNVDRAWLLYPCDPDSATFTVPLGVTVDEYRHSDMQEELPLDASLQTMMRDVLATQQPVTYEQGNPVLESELLKQYQVQSQMVIAIRPKSGKAWQFGLHQCRSIRQWTNYEKKLFKDISTRMSDAMASYLYAKELTSSNERNRVLLENAPEGIAVMDVETGMFVDANDNLLKMLGMTKERLFECNVNDISPSMQPDGHNSMKLAMEYIRATLNGEKPVFEWLIKNTHGGLITTEVRLVELPSSEHRLVRSSITDITLQKQQEEQLRRSQKMDAIGKLTGGIAHDFNNMLGVISGYAELLGRSLKGDEKLTKYTSHILKASDRGAQLTKKLLGFSRAKADRVEKTNINDEINDMSHMLEKTLTASIALKLDLAADCWNVFINKGDFEDVLLNMSINAMHAMPEGGKLLIKTENIVLSAPEALVNGLDVGEYVKLTISDNGIGMDAATQEKVFDPFFTTKGKIGTGLGLSQVYGFINRSGGGIKAYSELGLGTSFTLFIPSYHGAGVALESNPVSCEGVTAGGCETILVVDDEAALLSLSAEILGHQGYRVLTAGLVQDALDILKKHEVDLIISDVILPGINGYKFASILAEKYPQIKIQLVSGFSDIVDTDAVNEKLESRLLHKPFSSGQLLTNIRALLDE